MTECVPPGPPFAFQHFGQRNIIPVASAIVSTLTKNSPSGRFSYRRNCGSSSVSFTLHRARTLLDLAVLATDRAAPVLIRTSVRPA